MPDYEESEFSTCSVLSHKVHESDFHWPYQNQNIPPFSLEVLLEYFPGT